MRSPSLLTVVVIIGVFGLAIAAAGLVLERRQRTHQPPPVAWPGV